jgi:hypothetical protein
MIFTVGLAGVIYQTLATSTDRPYLLALYAGMMGLPVFLRLDSKEQSFPKPKIKPPFKDNHGDDQEDLDDSV